MSPFLDRPGHRQPDAVAEADFVAEIVLALDAIGEAGAARRRTLLARAARDADAPGR